MDYTRPTNWLTGLLCALLGPVLSRVVVVVVLSIYCYIRLHSSGEEFLLSSTETYQNPYLSIQRLPWINIYVYIFDIKMWRNAQNDDYRTTTTIKATILYYIHILIVLSKNKRTEIPFLLILIVFVIYYIQLDLQLRDHDYLQLPPAEGDFSFRCVTPDWWASLWDIERM